MKRTPWFSGEVKPVRNGWYECKVCDGKKHYFDGRTWRSYKGSPSSLFDIPFPWRGILKEPK